VIRVLVYAIQFLFWLLVVRLVLRAAARLFGGSAAPRTSTSQRRQMRPAEDLVLDRVCHTYVPRSRALSARVGGHEELFCSPACRDKAVATAARAS
jgi:hypothetical protein